MSKLNLFAINIDTPYNEIILADRARYKQLSPEDVQKYKDAFKASVLLFFTIIIIITMQVAC
jgi:ABC-type transporter MlaC component